MKKKVLSLLLCLCMTLSLLPLPAVAAQSDITWFGTTAEYPNYVKEAYPNGYKKLMQGDYYGTIDPAGNTKISFRYATLWEKAPGLFFATSADGKTEGVMDANENILIPFEYTRVHYTDKGYYFAEKNKKFGIISPANKVLVPFEYESIDATDDGTFIIKKGGVKGVMDKNYRITMQPSQPFLEYLGDGNYKVQKGNQFGTVDQTGKQLLPIQFSDVSLFDGGLAPVKKYNPDGGKNAYAIGFANSSGKVVTDFIYDSWSDNRVKSGLAGVSVFSEPYGNACYYINSTGKKAFPQKFAEAPAFIGDFAFPTTSDGRTLMINKSGKVITTLPEGVTGVDGPSPNANWITLVKGTAVAYGFISTSGKIVIPAVHQYAYGEGLYQFDPETGYIVMQKRVENSTATTIVIYDQNGNVILPAGKYREIFKLSGSIPRIKNGLLCVAKMGTDGETIGIIDVKGNEVVPFQYKNLGIYGGGLFAYGLTAADGGVINSKNKVVVPIQSGTVYDNLCIVVQGDKVGWLRASKLAKDAPKSVPANAAKVIVDGKSVSFEAYTIHQNNYFKLRDLAMALNGTPKQFDVGWDGAKSAVNITTGKPYTTVGGELVPGSGKPKLAAEATVKTLLNGTERAMVPFNISSNNFYKLRDVMQALDVYVGWDGSTITLDTGKTYGGNVYDGGGVPTVDKEPSRPTAALTPIEDPTPEGEYYIAFGKDGKKLLGMEGGKSAVGTPAIASTTGGEKFQFESVGPVLYRVKNVRTGLYLTLDGDRSLGDKVTFRAKTDQPNQLFEIGRFVDATDRFTFKFLKEANDYIRAYIDADSKGALCLCDYSTTLNDLYIMTDAVQPVSKLKLITDPKVGVPFHLSATPDDQNFVAAKGGSAKMGALAASDSANADTYVLEDAGGGMVRFQNTRTKYYLSVNGNKVMPRTEVLHWEKATDGSQLFYLKKKPDDTFFIFHKSGYYLCKGQPAGTVLEIDNLPYGETRWNFFEP
ncbi:MAG: WG repeat-containing protein [Oscillospiraceae bacterium]